ncbi:unnamed protein product [Auanema sp. JU1783]|nr:unnamed protein product [Auanema sp. JU1783]
MVQKLVCKGYASFLKYLKAKKGVDARFSIYVPLLLFSFYTMIASVKILVSSVGDQFINDLSHGSILLKNFAIIAVVLLLFSPFPSVGFMSNRQWNLSMFGIILLVTVNTSFVIYTELENAFPSLDLFESFFLVLILVDGIYRIFMYVPNSRIGYHSNRKFKTIELVTSQRFAPLIVILINVSSHMSMYKNWLIMSVAASTAIFSDLLLTPAYFLLYESLGVFPDLEDTSTSNDNYPSSSVRSQDPDSVVSKEQTYSSSISQGVNQKRSFCVQTSDIRRASMPVVIQHKQFSRNKKSTCSSQISNSTLQLGQENERNGSVISSSSVTETIEEEPIA